MKFSGLIDRKVLSNYFYLLLLQGANFLLPLITLPYLIKTLGIEKFGTVMIAASFITFFNILVDFGFNISATREVSLIRENKEELSEFFWSVMSAKLLLLAAGLVILSVLVWTVPKFHRESAVYLLSYGVVAGQALFPAWFFQGIENMRTITVINVIAKAIFTVLIFLLIKNPAQYVLVPLLNSLGFIIAGSIGLAVSLRYIYLRKPVVRKIRRLLGESSYLFLSNFSTNLYTSANTFILGMFAGDHLAGIYSSMEKLVIALKSMYIPFYQASFPWLSRKKFREKLRFINRIRPVVFVVGLSLSLLIGIFADVILKLIYHKPEINAYSNVFRLLGLIALFSGLGMMYVLLLFPALKMFKERMQVMVSGGLINITLALILVQFFDIYGIAVSAVTTEFLLFLTGHYIFMKKVIGHAKEVTR